MIFLLALAIAQPRTEVDFTKILARKLEQTTRKPADLRKTLPDGRRVDIYHDGVAWEVELCSKWEESIGQSMGYAIGLNATPGVWLLKRGMQDDEEYNQCLSVIAYLRGRGVTIEFRVTDIKELE